jgi:hypothetical protein
MRSLALAAALALAIPLSANADTVVVSHELNPANIGLNLNQETLASPFTLGVGDTLDFTLTFTGGPITLTGDTVLWLLSLTADGDQAMQVSGTFEFLGASGNLVGGPIPISQEMKYLHIGAYLTPGAYRLDSAPITFSGIRQILTINSSDADINVEVGASAREYYSVGLYTDGVVSGGAVVPEPGTWALMIVGFGAAGAMIRRRRLALV